MNKQEAKKRIDSLKEAINHHRYLYHVLDQQEISDAALDSLKHELALLERDFPEFVTQDSPTQRVEGKPLDKFRKVNHETRMLSMEDVFSADEIEEWEGRITKYAETRPAGYFAELKMDGLACSLVYEDGVLQVGATRGDGSVGEDVINNLKTVEAIPLRLRVPNEEDISGFLSRHEGAVDEPVFRKAVADLAGRVEVRGEVFMAKDVFDALNAEQAEAGQQPFANPRNAAAGSIRQLNPSIARQRRLDFYGYALIGNFGLQQESRIPETGRGFLQRDSEEARTPSVLDRRRGCRGQ
jgi:DNA ligase (NAD+)